MSGLLLNESTEGTITASCNKFQELTTFCENLNATGILFIPGRSACLICPLSCFNMLGRKIEVISGPISFHSISYIQIRSTVIHS